MDVDCHGSRVSWNGIIVRVSLTLLASLVQLPIDEQSGGFGSGIDAVWLGLDTQRVQLKPQRAESYRGMPFFEGPPPCCGFKRN